MCLEEKNMILLGCSLERPTRLVVYSFVFTVGYIDSVLFALVGCRENRMSREKKHLINPGQGELWHIRKLGSQLMSKMDYISLFTIVWSLLLMVPMGKRIIWKSTTEERLVETHQVVTECLL